MNNLSTNSDLIERFKKGQVLLHEQITVIKAKPKKSQEGYWQGFIKGVERLRFIANQMDKCPYEDDEPPGWCFACPLDNWSKEKCRAWKKGI